MKKIYLLFALVILSGFNHVSGQIVANDDSVPNVNGLDGGIGLYNVLNNDSLNSGSASPNTVTLTLLSSTNPSITITPFGWVNVSSGTAPGTYTLQYQICQNSNPSNCDTALVTVTVCSQAEPIVLPVACADAPGTLTLTGLPTPGTWTLSQQLYNNTPTTITGSGASYTVTGLDPGSYRFRVSFNGCTSAYTDDVSFGYYDAFDALMTGFYVDSNTDGIINIGDTVSYQIALTNVLACDVTNVTLAQSNIAIPGLPISVLPAGQTVNLTGTYILNQNDINAGSVFEWAGITGIVNGGSTYTKIFAEVSLEIPTGFQFIAFLDANANGVKDNGEVNFADGHFQYELNNDGIIHNAQDNSGQFTLFETNSVNLYDVSYSVYNSCASAYTVNPSSYTNIFASGAGFTTFYFPITSQSCADLAIHISPRQNPRPNIQYSHWISYSNNGTENISAGTISFSSNPNVTLISVSEPDAVISGNSFTYDFVNLQPGESRYFYVTLFVPNVPVVNLGDILTSNVSITIPAGDSNTANNSAELNAVVTNSYDPNDIFENHGPRIVLSEFDMDEELIYTVRFENTGNADALEIIVANLLDYQLDESSLRIIGSSHDFVMERIGEAFSVTFNDINLPPSVEGTDIGKGYFTYAIKVDPGIEVGNVIVADAYIYFDSNPAIVTNTWETEFVQQLSSQEVQTNTFSVYPNPAQSQLHIAAANESAIERITIFDVSGKVVLSKIYRDNQTSVDISALANGLYYISIQTSDNSQTIKFIKA